MYPTHLSICFLTGNVTAVQCTPDGSEVLDFANRVYPLYIPFILGIFFPMQQGFVNKTSSPNPL